MTTKPTVTFLLDPTAREVRAHRKGMSATFSVVGLLKLWGFISPGEDVDVVVEVVPVGKAEP